jgi:hypothetical protein
MIMNGEFKQLREIIENRNWSLVSYSGMIFPFKYRCNSLFLPYSREVLLSQAQVRYVPKNRITNNWIAFYDKLSDIIKSNRFNGIADIRIGNRAKGLEFWRFRKRGMSIEQWLL